jgi:cysteine-S-conjugate beta-lyase
VEGNEAVSSFAFTSGMSALSATLRLLKPGDIVLASKDLYGGMHRLLTHCVEHSGLDVRFVETWDLSKFKKELHSSSRVRMVFLESPTNPMMHVSDIRELAKLTHARAALLAVDNSIMTPVLSKPLDLGADLVIHSATKFLSGHSDTVGGIVTVGFFFFFIWITLLSQYDDTHTIPIHNHRYEMKILQNPYHSYKMQKVTGSHRLTRF